MKRNLTDLADEKNQKFLKQENFKYGISVKKNKKKSVVIDAAALSFFGAKLEKLVADILEDELCKTFKINKYKKILVVGLGNREISNDSLGPATVEKLVISRGLELKPEVCAISPNVFSNTGIETFDIINSITKIVQPDLVVLIDSLATLSVSRLCNCIQISNEGISAGSGANLKNRKISKNSLNVKNLITIGVPMLIYAENVIGQENKGKTNSITPLILSPINIKQNIQLLSNIISCAINKAVFKNLNKEEIDSLIR